MIEFKNKQTPFVILHLTAKVFFFNDFKLRNYVINILTRFWNVLKEAF